MLNRNQGRGKRKSRSFSKLKLHTFVTDGVVDGTYEVIIITNALTLVLLFSSEVLSRILTLEIRPENGCYDNWRWRLLKGIKISKKKTDGH